jgi:hypothetical protein
MGIASFFGQEIIKAPVKVDTTSFKLLSGSRYLVGGYGVTLDSDLVTTISSSLDTGTLTASTLYYVYLVVSSGTYRCVLSLNSTSPLGFLAYKFIGYVITNVSSQLDTCSQKYCGMLVGVSTGGVVVTPDTALISTTVPNTGEYIITATIQMYTSTVIGNYLQAGFSIKTGSAVYASAADRMTQGFSGACSVTGIRAMATVAPMWKGPLSAGDSVYLGFNCTAVVGANQGYYMPTLLIQQVS